MRDSPVACERVQNYLTGKNAIRVPVGQVSYLSGKLVKYQ
jgi:hypothetical protein